MVQLVGQAKPNRQYLEEISAVQLNELQLTGRDQTHLADEIDGCRLQTEVAVAFRALQGKARRSGFDLRVASGFRSFQRQLDIWNGKLCGTRTVHDDNGHRVPLEELTSEEILHAVLRYSALPGASRHHWGTDLDVYDAKALAPGQNVTLEPAEVCPGGVFDPLHCWLDDRISAGDANGFFRPYQSDCGGIAPERWHLSYAPLAKEYVAQLQPALLRRCWHRLPSSEHMLLLDKVEALLPQLFPRYIASADG